MRSNTPCIHFLGDPRESASAVVESSCQGMDWELRRHATAEVFLKALQTRRSGCLVVAPGRSMLAAAMQMTRELKRRFVLFPVVLIGRDDDPLGMEVAAVHNGALDAIRLPRDAERVSQCLLRAIAFDQAGASPQAETRDRLGGLSRREREVMDLTLQGNNTDEMAALLGVCYQTINKHRARIRSKMQVKCDVTLFNTLRIDPPQAEMFGVTAGGAVAGAAQTSAPPTQAPSGVSSPPAQTPGRPHFPSSTLSASSTAPVPLPQVPQSS